MAINRTPNYPDTLACVQALMGDFDPAVAIEKEVASLTPDHTFASRLAKQ